MEKDDDCVCCACPSRQYRSQSSIKSSQFRVHSSTHMEGTNLRCPKHNKIVDTKEIDFNSEKPTSSIKDKDDNSTQVEFSNQNVADGENTDDKNIESKKSIQEQDETAINGDENKNVDSAENDSNNRRVQFNLSSNCHCNSCPHDENNKEHKIGPENPIPFHTVGEDPIPQIPNFIPPLGWLPPGCCIPERCKSVPKFIPPLLPPPRLYGRRNCEKNIPPEGWVPLGWKAPTGATHIPSWIPPQGWIPPPGWAPPDESIPPPEFIPPPQWVPPDWTPPKESKPPEWKPPPKWIPPPNWTVPKGSLPPIGYLPPPGAVAPKGFKPPAGWLPPGWTPAIGSLCKCVNWKPPKYWIAPPDWVPEKGSKPPSSWIPPPGWVPYGWLPAPGLPKPTNWKPPRGWFPPPGWRPPPGSRPPPVNIIPYGWKLNFIRPEDRKILIPHMRYFHIMPSTGLPPGFIMPAGWKPGDKIPKGYPQYDGPDIEVSSQVNLPKGFPRVIKRGMTLPPGTDISRKRQKHNVKSGKSARKSKNSKALGPKRKEVETQISITHACICKPLNEKEIMENIRSGMSCTNYFCNCITKNKDNAEIEAFNYIDENKKEIQVLIVKRKLQPHPNSDKLGKTMAKHRKKIVKDIKKQLKATRIKPSMISK